jgi:cytochrome c oxidase accessory protein FixG
VRSRSADPAKAGLGSCVDCGICVQVCPTGIDIRNGLQYECIGCAACIDGCNQVMDKMGYPRGLIRYATERSVKDHLDRGAMLRRVFRPRVLIYTGILALVTMAALLTLAQRVPVKVDVIRDRVPMSADAGDGMVENVYRLQLMNTDETVRQFRISVTGLPDIRVESRENPVQLRGATSRMVPVRVRARPAGAERGASMPILFRVEAAQAGVPGAAPIVVEEQAKFIVP